MKVMIQSRGHFMRHLDFRAILFVCILVFTGAFAGCSGSDHASSLPPGGEMSVDSDGDGFIDRIDPDPLYGEPVAARDSGWFFLESFDGVELECRLLLPAGPSPYPCIMLPHGWNCDASEMLSRAMALRDDGYACLLWSARGWGNSGGLVRLDSSEYEVKDTIRLINWLSAQAFVIQQDTDDARLFENKNLVDFDFNMDRVQEADDIPGDEDRDFVLGMSGCSYGGAIQLLTASYDHRIDAIVPERTWNDLQQSLCPGDAFKVLWSLGFYAGGLLRNQEGSGLDPHLGEWLMASFLTNEVSPGMREGIRLRSPCTRMDKVIAPCLVIQGEKDTLFDLKEGVRTFEDIRVNGVDAKMYWYDGGHAYPTRDQNAIESRVHAWLDHYLKDDTVDTGPEFEYDMEYSKGVWGIGSGDWPLVPDDMQKKYYLHAGGALVCDTEVDARDYVQGQGRSYMAGIPIIPTSLSEIQAIQSMLPPDMPAFDSMLTSVSFTTDPFYTDAQITGIPGVKLWFSALGTDITFFVKLYDISPNGDEVAIPYLPVPMDEFPLAAEVFQDKDLINHMVTPRRIPLRDSGDNVMPAFDERIYNSATFKEINEAFVEKVIKGSDLEEWIAGIPVLGTPRMGDLREPQLHTFDLAGITRVIRAGHRLKLTIATSDLCYLNSRIPGAGIIWHDEEHPSSLSIPVMDSPELCCNGFSELCSLPYNDVSYATAHNAFNHADGLWLAPNQNHSIARQLTDGVRAFMIDVHPYDGPIQALKGIPYVCHESCWFGGQSLVKTLETLRVYLDHAPNEVLSIIFECYVDRAGIREAFEESGLMHYCYAHRRSQPWPTLEEMIEMDKRIVVFTDRDGGGRDSEDWYMDVWAFAWETHYHAESPSDFSCEINRGSYDNDLFILNHFLTAPLGAQFLAEQVNYNPFLVDRAQECQQEHSQVPNFVTVDFYATGDLIQAVNILNNVDQVRFSPCGSTYP
ncbi:MAG: CocE/NonD family hydrolase [Thermodesulfobacteriota bacterium]|nr:CocE/NonD family hydrolase [Thermodesulfobacteriota bacterium]